MLTRTRILLHLEGAVAFAVALALYWRSDGNWLLFVMLLLRQTSACLATGETHAWARPRTTCFTHTPLRWDWPRRFRGWPAASAMAWLDLGCPYWSGSGTRLWPQVPERVQRHP